MKTFTLLFLFLPLLFQAQTVTTISPNSGVTDALIFTLDGNLYGADYTGSAVFEIALPGGASTSFSGGYNTPNGMAIGSDGILYMADNVGGRIVKIFPDGSSETFVEMYNPSGLIFLQGTDTLIATSYMGDKLVKISPDSMMTDWSVGGELNGGPVGLCYDDEGNLYVGNFDNRKITQILPDGEQVPITQGPTNGWLGFIDYAGGYIYGTLYSTHKIFRYNLDGSGPPEVILGSTAGNTNGGPDEAKFNAPNGILASPHGDTLYISDYNTSNIRMITNLEGTPSSAQEVFKKEAFEFLPNPFADRSLISFELAVPAKVSIELHNVEGRLIRSILEKENLAAGMHQVEVSGIGLPNGVYHLVLKTKNGATMTQKIIRAK